MFLQCEICQLVLPSAMAFAAHMKKKHKDSDQEQNKPFKCELCEK